MAAGPAGTRHSTIEAGTLRPTKRDRKASDQKPASRSCIRAALEQTYVLLASFLIGATILVIEIVGTRVIGPYYGASVYVWSSLIGVTLASLAVGYFLGGGAADRWPPLPSLALAMIGSALWLLLVPWMRQSVLAFTTPLGLKVGSLASAALLFTAPLVLLSMTGPIAIRLVTSDFTFLGRGVGKIYGVSTLGSMLGAIVTGFVLIPTFSVSGLLKGTAVVLLGLGGAGLFVSRWTLAGASVLVSGLLACIALTRAPAPPSNVVYLGNSFYGELKVIDSAGARLLLINGIDNGFVDRQTMESLAPYTAFFRYLPAARSQARRALCIGLGAGRVPREFHVQHGLATEVVEIDPAIVTLARRYFDFPADIPVIVEDGRTYVERTPHRYDFVVLDAFASETLPAHLFTREFFARAQVILEPAGILAINMIGLPDGPAGAAWRSVHRTLAERFAHVRAFAGPQSPDARDRYTNLFLVASQAPLPAAAELGSTAPFDSMQRGEIHVAGDAEAVVLTDDYNPLESLQLPFLVLLREDMIRKAQSVLLFDGTR
jgi:spermidine synthase